MNFIKNIINKFKRSPKKARKKGYTGASTGELHYNWGTTIQTADEILKTDLRPMRARSRNLAQNNDYMKKFLRLVKNNVVGPNGIKLQVKSKFLNGKIDKNSNNIIEKAWKKWCRKEYCDVTGQLNFNDMLRMIIESVARDGEILVRKVVDKIANKNNT